MTKLLVSVRSLEEASLAAEAGVDLIDLKEPSRGSLGRVDAEVARLVCERFAHGRPLSMALGELADWLDTDRETTRQMPEGVAFAKLGLAGMAAAAGWADIWRRAFGALPPRCKAVAVVYADWRRARAPEPARVLDAAVAGGCAALLVDTWCKDFGNVFAQSSHGQLDALFRRARSCGLLTVLAGSLSFHDAEAGLSLSPDYLAVRGAVCHGPRDGRLCPARLREWCKRIRQAGQFMAGTTGSAAGGTAAGSALT